MEVLQFFGRLHPLILHLPIGILALAFLMEWMSRYDKYAALKEAVGFALALGWWSALVACISGYILSREGGYSAGLIQQHQWLGIATATTSLIVLLLHKNKDSNYGKAYFPTFGILLLLLGATGHQGGSITHGSEFLLEPFTAAEDENIVITDIATAELYGDLVRPIFKKKCVSCHNDGKTKGDLLLNSEEGILAGGESGAFMEKGDIENSLFLQRIHLPLEEKEHMPPDGRRQLSKDEIKLLEWWVANGAGFETTVGELEKDPAIESILEQYTQVDNSVYALDVKAPDNKVLTKLNEDNIKAIPVSESQVFIQVNLSGRQDLSEATFKELSKIREQIVELNLSNTNVTDDMVLELSQFPHLTRILLHQTSITGSSLGQLKELQYLESINLYETEVSNENISQLKAYPALQKVFLWKTKVSKEVIADLQKSKPNLQIDQGVDLSIFGIEEAAAGD